MQAVTSLAVGLVGLVAVGCGGSSSSSDPASDGGSGETAIGTDATSDTTPSDGAPTDTTPSDGAPPSSCEPFGHYGVPMTTFTLPAGKPNVNYPDVQKSFPEVDWSKLDRLYIPAGTYKFFNLGNLPTRDPSRPLVITNLGGQVQVGPNDVGANYLWTMGGGSGWVLTGRYDPDSKTGDVGFQGHRCGKYAESRGKYGFASDDDYAKGTYLHMGVFVGAATSFELEFLEVSRSGFAGIRLLNAVDAPGGPKPMENVRVHDTYVHDTDGEGYYFGWTGTPPSGLFPKLQVYNNRIIRCGNEGLQIQDLGDGTEVHHNVVAFTALHYRDNGLGKYQDGNAQVSTREGTISLHHNVFLGGAGTLLSLFSAPQTGDGERHVTFADNYFGETMSLGAYLNGTASEASSYTWSHNYFHAIDFGYDKLDPTAKDPGIVFGQNPPFKAVTTFSNNAWDGARKLFAGLTGGSGTVGTFTATGNTNAAVAPFTFVASDDYDTDARKHLEAWAAKATVSPGAPAITYAPGDRVTDGGDVYECLTTSTNETPHDHPAAWKKLPTPVDDVRAPAGSVYADLGVH